MNMGGFEQIFDRYHWERVKRTIYSKTNDDVERALQKSTKSLEDFAALISPAASNYLEEIAQQSHTLTQKRFGKTIQLFIPMYLSNECQNICTYCGFSLDNNIRRITLSEVQIKKEIAVIKDFGYDHILLVTGEANKTVGVGYLKKALELIRPHFSSISIEMQPLEEKDYRTLKPLGVNSVFVYQETYNRASYKSYHPKGKKANFEYRLGTPDKIGRAGMYKIGLGCLLGLEDWRVDSFFTALHLNYLEKTYWQTKFSISFPRIRPAENVTMPQFPLLDRDLIQLICAYRLFNKDIELSLSTRESRSFRDHAIKLGITSISAGSKTNPGGYSNGTASLKQFEISDERPPGEIAQMLMSKGYEPVWKDWDPILEQDA